MKPFPLDDDRWKGMEGGYRQPYDPSPALLKLLQSGDVDAVWKELWDELHHQGDVGEASYATIPALLHICRERNLMSWNLFALASRIDNCRSHPANPPIPAWLCADYEQAWHELFEYGLECLRHTSDKLLVRTILSVIALHKGLHRYGELLAKLDESEIEDLHKRYLAE